MMNGGETRLNGRVGKLNGRFKMIWQNIIFSHSKVVLHTSIMAQPSSPPLPRFSPSEAI